MPLQAQPNSPIYLTLVKRALASMKAEIRALDARVGVSARLLEDERKRAGVAAGQAMRSDDAWKDLDAM